MGDQELMLHAAYQQISVLNTQMAHLYTELTMARTELVSIQGGEARDGGAVVNGAASYATNATQEAEKRSNQIADLVSDIRHLQLDLEYHQQKLDQMIEEKRDMMVQLREKNRLLQNVY